MRLFCVAAFCLSGGGAVCYDGAVKRSLPKCPVSFALPPAGVWDECEQVAAYARACMRVCGLCGWFFKWDHAVRRLGCCKPTLRTLSLSLYFVQAQMGRNQEIIRRTILHEIAHALAWVKNGVLGHGEAWRYWCAALGIAGEKSTSKCEDFAPARSARRPKYALCHVDTGEVYCHYFRRPALNPEKLKSCYIPGQKAATLGKLCVISLADEPNLGQN